MLRRTGFWKLACRMNGKQLLETVRKIARRSGKNKIFLFFDVLYCGVAYGTGYQDYRVYEFEKLARPQRRTYVTRGFNNRMVCLLNDKEKREQFFNKGNFNRRYQDLMGRDFLDLTQCREKVFLEFIKNTRCSWQSPQKVTAGVRTGGRTGAGDRLHRLGCVRYATGPGLGGGKRISRTRYFAASRTYPEESRHEACVFKAGAGTRLKKKRLPKGASSFYFTDSCS